MEPSGSADYLDNVLTKIIVNNRRDSRETDGNLFFMITIVKLSALACCPAQRINYELELVCLSAY